MRHHSNIRKFGRVKKVRDALIRGLAVSLIRDGKIRTTETKARELRPFIEKLVTRGKIDTVASRRLLISRLGRPEAAAALTEKISPQYKERAGGYTRIVKLAPRKGDASPMAIIEFVQ